MQLVSIFKLQQLTKHSVHIIILQELLLTAFMVAGGQPSHKGSLLLNLQQRATFGNAC